MEFEYAEELKKLKVDCPPKHYKAKNMERVYRWVFEEIDDPRNFTPRYFFDKQQETAKLSDYDKCSRLALSMFVSREYAIARFETLLDSMKDAFYQLLGTHLAEGALSEEDGVSGKVDKNGHFNYHPFKGCQYQERFVIKEKLES